MLTQASLGRTKEFVAELAAGFGVLGVDGFVVFDGFDVDEGESGVGEFVADFQEEVAFGFRETVNAAEFAEEAGAFRRGRGRLLEAIPDVEADPEGGDGGDGDDKEGDLARGAGGVELATRGLQRVEVGDDKCGGERLEKWHESRCRRNADFCARGGSGGNRFEASAAFGEGSRCGFANANAGVGAEALQGFNDFR